MRNSSQPLASTPWPQPSRRGRAGAAASLAALALLSAACSSSSKASSAKSTATTASSATASSGGATNAPSFLTQAQSVVAAATAQNYTWQGPTTGPTAQPGKTIVVVASDLTNSGVATVASAIEQAAATIHWTVKTIDGKGSTQGQTEGLQQALALHPDGIVIDGFNYASQVQALSEAASLHIPVVSWNAAPEPGPSTSPPVFYNVGVSPEQISQVAADYAIVKTNGKANVVVLTDNEFAIAETKANLMVQDIKQCSTCKVLAVENTPIADVTTRIPPLTTSLLQRYHSTWNVTLGINDNYFLAMSTALRSDGISTSQAPINISAGDGSPDAFQRIRSGDYQAATVAAPLNLQGWQVVDELNRAINNQPPSDYVAPVRLVTHSDVAYDGGPQNTFIPNNNYQQHYEQIWGVG